MIKLTGNLLTHGKRVSKNVTVIVEADEGTHYTSGILNCKVVEVRGGNIAHGIVKPGALVDFDTEHSPMFMDAVENAWSLSID